MRSIVVVGAGAMGCLFGARLAQHGVEVTLVDVDRDRLDRLDREGVTLVDDDGTRTIRLAARSAADVTGPVDLVMLFTKGMHNAAAIRSVAHLAQTDTYALTLQNGLGNAEALAEIFAADRVLLGVTDFPADLTGPASVTSHGGGHVRLGAYGSGTEGAHAAAKVLNAAGLNCVVDPRVEIAVWEKAAFNAALNAMAAITGLTVGGMASAAGRRIAASVVDEVVATAAGCGILLDGARIGARIDFAFANHGGHKASMLQDRLAGRPTEIETINGAIERFARAAGVAVPVTATMADLVRMTEPGHHVV